MCMESIQVSTLRSFSGSSGSPKRKKHTSTACEPCLGGKVTAAHCAPTNAKFCNHCAILSKQCVWPQEDGRKKGRTSSPGKTAGHGKIPIASKKDNSDLRQIQSLNPPTPHSSLKATKLLEPQQTLEICPLPSSLQRMEELVIVFCLRNAPTHWPLKPLTLPSNISVI